MEPRQHLVKQVWVKPFNQARKLMQSKPHEWTYSCKQEIWTKWAQCWPLDMDFKVLLHLGQCSQETPEETQLSLGKVVGN